MEDTGDLWEKYVKRDFRNKVLKSLAKPFKPDLLYFSDPGGHGVFQGDV